MKYRCKSGCICECAHTRREAGTYAAADLGRSSVGHLAHGARFRAICDKQFTPDSNKPKHDLLFSTHTLQNI